MTSDTVANVLQLISDLRGEASTNTNANRIRSVSRAEQDIAGRTFFRVHLLRDQSLGTGDGTTANFTIGSTTFPMRPKGVAEVFVGGMTDDKRIPVIDYMAYKTTISRNSAEQVAYEWYDQANDLWKVHINRAPSVGDAVTASYFFMPPKRTLTSDTVICPSLLALARLANGYIYEYDDEVQRSQLEKAEAEQLIADLLAVEHSPAVNQSYAMTAIENDGRTRGLGTY